MSKAKMIGHEWVRRGDTVWWVCSVCGRSTSRERNTSRSGIVKPRSGGGGSCVPAFVENAT